MFVAKPGPHPELHPFIQLEKQLCRASCSPGPCSCCQLLVIIQLLVILVFFLFLSEKLTEENETRVRGNM